MAFQKYQKQPSQYYTFDARARRITKVGDEKFSRKKKSKLKNTFSRKIRKISKNYFEKFWKNYFKKITLKKLLWKNYFENFWKTTLKNFEKLLWKISENTLENSEKYFQNSDLRRKITFSDYATSTSTQMVPHLSSPLLFFLTSSE